MVVRAAYHMELHVQRVVPAAAAGVAAVSDVDVAVSRAPEHAGGSSRRRRPAEDAPVRVAGARLLPLRHRRQIELRVSVRGSSVRYVQ